MIRKVSVKIVFKVKIFLMKKVIVLRKIQGAMKTLTPPFFNHFSLSLNRKKRTMTMRAWRAMRKKLQNSRSQIFFRIGVH